MGTVTETIAPPDLQVELGVPEIQVQGGFSVAAPDIQAYAAPEIGGDVAGVSYTYTAPEIQIQGGIQYAAPEIQGDVAGVSYTYTTPEIQAGISGASPEIQLQG